MSIYFLTFLAIVASVFLWRRMKRTGQESSIRYEVFSNAFEFFAVFATAGVLYSGLQVWIDSAKFTPTDLSTVGELERNIVEIRHTLLPILDPSPWVKSGVIVALVLLAVISPALSALKLVPRAKFTLKWFRRVYLLLTVAASFTFFGSAIAPVAAERIVEIKSKLDEIRTGYQVYETKVEKLARRTIVRSLETQTDYSVCVERYKEYLRAHNDAIDRIRARPHSEQITFELDADNLLRENNHELGDFSAAIAREDKNRTSTPGSSVEIHDLSAATFDRSRALNESADTLLSASDESTNKLDTLVEETASLAHDEVSKPIIERLVATLSDTLAENELFKLFYEPFLQTPIEELTKKLAKQIFVSTTDANRAKSLPDAIGSASKFAAEEVNSIVQPPKDRIAVTAQQFGTLTAKMQDLQVQSDNEVSRKATTLSAEKLSAFENEWTHRMDIYDIPALRSAADADLLVAKQLVAKELDPLARLELLGHYEGVFRGPDTQSPDYTKPPASTTVLLGAPEAPKKAPTKYPVLLSALRFERTTLHASNIRDALRSEVKPLLAKDDGAWGDLRREMLDSDVVGKDASAVKNVKDLQSRISSWRTEVALDALLSKQFDAVNSRWWDEQFYKYMLHNGDAAAIWGWVVKDTYHDEIQHVYGSAVPETGFRYYVEVDNLGSNVEVRNLFSLPTTVSYIKANCGSDWQFVPRE